MFIVLAAVAIHLSQAWLVISCCSILPELKMEWRIAGNFFFHTRELHKLQEEREREVTRLSWCKQLSLFWYKQPTKISLVLSDDCCTFSLQLWILKLVPSVSSISCGWPSCRLLLAGISRNWLCIKCRWSSSNIIHRSSLEIRCFGFPGHGALAITCHKYQFQNMWSTVYLEWNVMQQFFGFLETIS